ncbi:MAG: SRPBCC family protein [Terriglobales bacterium]
MARKFWRGFAIGAAAGAGAGLGAFVLSNALGARKRRVVRLEKSLQIGRPVHEVFDSWTNLERLPNMSDVLGNIRAEGDRSHWSVRVDGRALEWDAIIEQFIPDQAIGWKSISGPKHTGRMTFSPIGSDTLVQVTMNYAPPSRLLKPFAENVGGYMGRCIEQVLRDFKSALEGKGQEGRKPAVRGGGVDPGTGMTQTDVGRATGTFGSSSPSPSKEAVDRFGNRANPVEYTSPPEAKR